MKCNICDAEVNTTLAGESNLLRHQTSYRCREMAARKKGSATLGAWLKKPSDGEPSATSSRIKPLPLITGDCERPPEASSSAFLQPALPAQTPITTGSLLNSTPDSSNTIHELREMCLKLPSSVPEACEGDLGLSHHFRQSLPSDTPRDDAWEKIDALLNRVCGGDVHGSTQLSRNSRLMLICLRES